ARVGVPPVACPRRGSHAGGPGPAGRRRTPARRRHARDPRSRVRPLPSHTPPDAEPIGLGLTGPSREFTRDSSGTDRRPLGIAVLWEWETFSAELAHLRR